MWLYGCGVLKDKNFYFALKNSDLYKFDLNTETVTF